MQKYQRFEIRIAGFGGQGIVTIGKILGIAFSMYSGKNSVNTQSYGPESRGGACRSDIIVSEDDIKYPYVRNADVFIALSSVAYNTYIHSLKEDGILIVDCEAIKSAQREYKGLHLYKVPTAKLAYEAGNIKAQNAVALGAFYSTIQDFISEKSLKRALEDAVPQNTIIVNLAAFEKGRRYIISNYFIEN
jgi:2-oxoglutarate ferredoxin oxidoreductase subunit gamma